MDDAKTAALNNGIAMISANEGEHFWALNENVDYEEHHVGPFPIASEAAEDACRMYQILYDCERTEQQKAKEWKERESYVEEPKSYQYVEIIENLKRSGDYEEARILLYNILDEQETYSQKTGSGVAPWFYWHLAIVLRKMGRADEELTVLERYDKQIKAQGRMSEKLRDRLEKVRYRHDKIKRE